MDVYEIIFEVKKEEGYLLNDYLFLEDELIREKGLAQRDASHAHIIEYCEEYIPRVRDFGDHYVVAIYRVDKGEPLYEWDFYNGEIRYRPVENGLLDFEGKRWGDLDDNIQDAILSCAYTWDETETVDFLNYSISAKRNEIYGYADELYIKDSETFYKSMDYMSYRVN